MSDNLQAAWLRGLGRDHGLVDSARDYAKRIANLSGTGTGPSSNGNYFQIASGRSS